MEFLRALGLLLAAACCGCTGAAPGADAGTGPVDPLTSGDTYSTPGPARFAVVLRRPFGLRLAASLEFSDAVWVLDGVDATAHVVGKVDVGRGPRALAATDVEGDGVDEVVTADTASHSVTVAWLRNEGSSRTVALPMPSAPLQVAGADFTGDGRGDALVVLGEPPDVTVVPLVSDGIMLVARPASAAPGVTRVVPLWLDDTPPVRGLALSVDGKVQWIRVDASGAVAWHEPIPVCADPTGAAVLHRAGARGADVVVSCRSGALSVLRAVSPVMLTALRVELVPYASSVYDVAVLDWTGGALVLGVDTFHHRLGVWSDSADGRLHWQGHHATSRGPVSLAVFPAAARVIVVAYEARLLEGASTR